MNARNLAAAAAAVLLAACGSKSSSDDAPVAPSVRYPVTAALDVAFTTTTDTTAIAGTAAGIARSLDVASIMAGMGGVGGKGAPGPTAPPAPPAPGVVALGAGAPHRPATVRSALLLAQDALARRDLATVSGAYATATASCPGGGSVSMAAQQASQTQTSTGDFVKISFSACNDGQGSVAFGSLRMDVLEATAGVEFVADATTITSSRRFGLGLVVHDFATTMPDGSWSGIDGDLEVSFVATVESFDPVAGGTGSIEFQMSGGNLVAASGPNLTTIDEATRITGLSVGQPFHELGRELYTGMGTPAADRTETQWDLDAKVCAFSTVRFAFGGCLSILTDPTFAKHELKSYPYVGALKVSDGAGHFVRVTAVDETSGAATLDWDIFGVGSKATTWGCLDGTAACP